MRKQPKITHTMQKVAVDILEDLEVYFMSIDKDKVPEELWNIYKEHYKKYELMDDPFTHMVCTTKDYFKLKEENKRKTMIERFGYYEER